MNVKLRVELLARLWKMLDEGRESATEQELYGVPVTARIEPIYKETLYKFLTRTLPSVFVVEDSETGLIAYEFANVHDCQRHIINEVLINNRATFVRFILATYTVEDADSAIASADLWAFILSWARKYDVAPAYIPVTQHSLTSELESLGYIKCKVASGTGFWGIRLDHSA